MLDELALKYGTDKGSQYHGYTRYYEMVLGPIKDQPLKIMEIGIHKGASLKMWKEYFPNAIIYGIDANPDCKFLEEDRIFIATGSQEHTDFLNKTINKAGHMDIIIDDGSHLSTHQILTFNVLFPFVKPGGWYIIEDLYASYLPNYNENADITGLAYCQKLVGHINLNGKSMPIPSKHRRIKELEAKGIELNYLEKNIEYLFFFPGMCMIKKLGEPNV